MVKDNVINFEERPVTYCMSIIGGKWKTIIIFLISLGINRFGRMQHNCAGISKKMLTNQLRELEKNGVIKRKTYAETPPHVEYFITIKGETLFPIIGSMKTWGEGKMKDRLKNN